MQQVMQACVLLLETRCDRLVPGVRRGQDKAWVVAHFTKILESLVHGNFKIRDQIKKQNPQTNTSK